MLLFCYCLGKIVTFLGKDKNMWVLFPQFICLKSYVIFTAAFFSILPPFIFPFSARASLLNTARPSHNFLTLIILVAQTPVWNICCNVSHSLLKKKYSEGKEKMESKTLLMIIHYVTRILHKLMESLIVKHRASPITALHQ